MRVHVVKAAQLVPIPRVCGECNREIEVGELYRWIKPRIGGKRYRCFRHQFRPSHLAGGRYAEALATQEGLDDDFRQFRVDGDLDELETAVQHAVEEARRIAEEYEDGIANMPDSLQDGPTAQESQERADRLNEWADELEGVDFDGPKQEIEDAEDETQRIKDQLASEVESAIANLSI